jgi:hypothetical protein
MAFPRDTLISLLFRMTPDPLVRARTFKVQAPPQRSGLLSVRVADKDLVSLPKVPFHHCYTRANTRYLFNY